MKKCQALQNTLILTIAALFLLSACNPINLAAKSATETGQGNSQAQTPTPTPTQTVTATSTPSATPTPEIPGIYVDPNLPAAFQNSVQLEAAGFISSAGENAAASLAFEAEAPISYWVYALVAPFPTVTDGINAAELQAFWQEVSPTVFDRLILDKSSYTAIQSIWGEPAGNVEVIAGEDLLSLAWNTPGTWAIIPF